MKALELTTKFARFFDFEYANFAAVIFFTLGILTILGSGGLIFSSAESLGFLAHFAFLHGFHVLFQYWMIATNSNYKFAVETTTGRSNLIQSMVVATAVIALLLILGKVLKISFALAEVAFRGWAMMHTMGQTYGIYCAKAASENGSNHIKRYDIKLVKFFVLFTVIFHMTIATLQAYQLPYNLSKEVYITITTIKFLLLSGVFVFLVHKKLLSFSIFWVLVRLSLGACTLFLPKAALGLAAIHGAEYFDIARKVEKSSGEIKNKRSRRFEVGFVIGMLFLVFVNYNFVFMTKLNQMILIGISSLDLSITLVHYLFDTFAYKLKNLQVRNILIDFIK